MKKNILFLISILILCTVNVKAQQEPQFTQYWFNHASLNPGVVGLNDAICADILIRNQWSGIDGGPTTNFASINTPIEPFGFNSGIGLVIFQDNLGFEKRSNFKLSYSYHLPLSGGTLGLGFDAGWFKYDNKPSWLASEANDPLLVSEEFTDNKFDLGLGAFYKSKDMYAGFSVDNITSPTLEQEGDSTSHDFIQLRRHTYLTGGYTLQLPIPLLEVTPRVMIKSSIGKKGFVGTQIDFTAIFTYNDRFWGGVSHRLQDSFGAIVGFELFNGLKIGFSKDFAFSKLARYGRGSWEVYLGYCFEMQTKVKQKKYKSVRFL